MYCVIVVITAFIARQLCVQCVKSRDV